MSMLALLAGRFRFRLDDRMGGEEGVRALQISNFTLSVEGGLFMHVYSRASSIVPPPVASNSASRDLKPRVPGAVECDLTISSSKKL
jgi:hypothetical protein